MFCLFVFCGQTSCYCYSNAIVLQPCIACKCAAMIYTLQTVDFMQVFQSVIIVCSPLAAAALVLYLKTVALSCVNAMIRGVVLKKR